MLNAAVKLCQGKLIVTELMVTTKYSFCYNCLKSFCLRTGNKMAKHIHSSIAQSQPFVSSLLSEIVPLTGTYLHYRRKLNPYNNIYKIKFIL